MMIHSFLHRWCYWSWLF